MDERLDKDVSLDRGLERFADGPVVVFTWRNDPGWPVEYVSPNVERLFGYSPSELYDGDLRYAELVHDGDLGRVAEEVEANSDATTERFRHEPYRIVTKSGDTRWVLDYTRIVRDGGETVRYTGYVVDITERKERLEYVTDLNATIRSLHRALIDADSEASICRAVCRSLVDLERFDGVWIGTVDSAASSLSPVASAGLEEGFLDTGPWSLAADSPSPAVQVAADRSSTGEYSRPNQASEDPWESAMWAADYRSAVSVPVRHDGIRYGVLTVYSAAMDSFDERVQSILIELGALVGYAIAATERRDALHAEGAREFVLKLEVDRDDPLRTLAAGVSATVDVRSVSRRGEDLPLLYCLIADVTSSQVIETAATIPGVRSIECLDEEETPLYEVLVDGECVASTVTAFGAGLRSLRISEGGCDLVVSVRRKRDRRRLVEQARSLFGEAELKAERGIAPSDTMAWASLLTDALTERQQSVLRAAYHAGYFDESRKRTGAEIADSLGIAQPTFSTHIRAAVRNLLSAIWNDREGK